MGAEIARTDADGRVVLLDLRASDYNVSIPEQEIFSPGGRLQHYLRTGFGRRVTVVRDFRADVTVHLSPWMEISGRMVDASGRPWTGRVYTAGASEKAVDGKFRIRIRLSQYPLNIGLIPFGSGKRHEQVIPPEAFEIGGHYSLGDIEIPGRMPEALLNRSTTSDSRGSAEVK